MMANRSWWWLVATLALLTLSLPPSTAAQGGVADILVFNASRSQAAPDPPRYPPPGPFDPAGRIRYWNQIALDANALDHTPVVAGDSRIFGEQLGPTRTSRALAIIHIALFDAVNAIAGGYRSYTGLPPAPPGTSLDAAIAQAAHDTLVALYPSQSVRFDVLLAVDLRRIGDGPATLEGIQVGRRAATAILALRTNDGSQQSEPRVGLQFILGNTPGNWRPDPISQIPLAVGAYWGAVRPFVLPSVSPFRARPPPALTSPEYAAAFNEVKLLGGDGVVTRTVRTPEQTAIGIYWGYDGTPGLGTPPRLYNQIAVQIATQRGTPAVELARLLALVNVALADTCIAIWETKYVYQFWRPVTAIREAGAGTGPTGAGDSNPATIGDPTFTPLGAPASNTSVQSFTPPFPAYVSGHAGFGAALFETLRVFYGTDHIAFTFVSDEFNGVTRDNRGNVRPLMARGFSTLTQAEEENAQSRIYLGIHWAFDKSEGINQGRRVADYVFSSAFVPLPPTSVPPPILLPPPPPLVLVPTGGGQATAPPTATPESTPVPSEP
jgi:hypothetical protein